MSGMITAGTECIRKYRYLVTKMKFPTSIIPTFINLSKIFINSMLIVAIIIVFWAFGFKPDIYLLQIPFYLVLAFVFFNLWALFSSFIGAISKDFVNLVKSFLTAVFWLSGILWNTNTATNPWLIRFLNLNPITFLVNGFRNCFINKIWFWEQPKRLMYFGIITLILLIAGLWSYKKLRKDIADVL